MDIYREEILDHFKNPRNYGEMKGEGVKAREANASCGDVMEMSLRVKGDKIEKVRFQGEGCVVSLAAASMLTEMIKGKTVEEVERLTDKEVAERLRIKISPGRRKCVRLGLEVCQKALKKLKR